MSMIKTIWKDPVGIAVIGGAILAITGSVIATSKGWWPKIWAGLGYAWNWLSLPSSHPNWLLIILWLSAFVVFFYIVARTIFTIRAANSSAPTWRSYRRDTFNGVVWHWGYGVGPHSSVESLTPICPSCQCQLMSKNYEGDYYGDHYWYALYCTHCAKNVAEFKEQYVDTLRKIELLIGRNIRSGDWRKAIGAEISSS